MSKFKLTQSQSHFAENISVDIPRSKFLRNSTKKTTFNCGKLVPVYVDEVLPGDTFEMDLKFISRLTTPIFPTMDLLNLEFHAFYVPNRLVWDGWEELNGENKTGAWVPAETPALVPMYNTGTIESKSIGDYLGLPLGLDMSKEEISVLPFRAYGLIYNEWYRDQNTQAPIAMQIGNTFDVENELFSPIKPLLSVNKKHDLFTSCLPSPQKGESMLIPIELNDLIPVITGESHDTTGVSLAWHNMAGNTPSSSYKTIVQNNGYTQLYDSTNTSGGYWGDVIAPGNLWADGRGMQLNTTTISELRSAFQIQKLYEKDARGGTRYVEMLKAHFGVDAMDYRLQRPELLGIFSSPVGMQQVAQTSATQDGTSPQGNLAAFSYTANGGNFFNKSFVEHGFIMIFAIARQPKTYQQGIDRMFSRKERFDFYYPALANISEQPILNKQIFNSNDTKINNQVFGYNEAWPEYRYKPNQVTGQFRSGIKNTLDNWHYADWYNELPILSSEFMVDNSEENVARTLAVSTELSDQILLDVAFLCQATRPMPVHSIPGMVDHF